MIESISVSDLKREIDNGTARTLLDVREPWEYKLCRLDNSINIPLSQITTRLEDLDKDSELVVICHHGSRSFQAACYLQSVGFNARLFNLEGGIAAWADTIDKQMPRY